MPCMVILRKYLFIYKHRAITWVVRLGVCELVLPDQKGVAKNVAEGHFNISFPKIDGDLAIFAELYIFCPKSMSLKLPDKTAIFETLRF